MHSKLVFSGGLVAAALFVAACGTASTGAYGQPPATPSVAPVVSPSASPTPVSPTPKVATGTKIGDWTLQAFDLTQDKQPPKLSLDQGTGLVTNQSPTITGSVIDNLSGVALLQARKVQRRAAAIGFEYATTADAFGDLESELRELSSELGDEPEPEREPLDSIVGEIGDVLFACVNVARRYNCDPELALRAATARFRERVECAERLAGAEGVVFRAAGTPEQEHYYQAAKQSLREGM